MKYRSTRGSAPLASAAEAIVRGIAPDGGLYVPCEVPQLCVQEVYGLSYAQAAAKVLGLFLQEYSPDFLLSAAQEVYGPGFCGKAGHVQKVEEGRYVLELWHGPTCAFKDYALQLMPRLLVEAKRMLGDTRTTEILVATSGDTGKAALAGFAGLPGIQIAVFYPSHGTSEIQRLQMATQEGENVAVYAIRGNFDDAQAGVKRAFASEELREWDGGPTGGRSPARTPSTGGALCRRLSITFTAMHRWCRPGSCATAQRWISVSQREISAIFWRAGMQSRWACRWGG